MFSRNLGLLGEVVVAQAALPDLLHRHWYALTRFGAGLTGEEKRASVSDTLVFKLRRPPTSFWKGLWLCTTYDITLAQEEIAIWALARNWAPPKATPRATHVPVASDDERHRLKVPKVRSAASRREAARPQEEKIQSKAIHQSSNRPKRRRRDGVTTRSRAVRSPHHSARLEREETLQTGRDAESRRFPRRRSR